MEAAARKLWETPRIRQQKKTQKRKKRKKRTIEERRYRVEVAKHITLYAAAMLFVVVNAARYLGVRGHIEELTLDIAKLEKQVAEKRQSNDALAESLNKTPDLEELYFFATTELGMVFPDKNEIILYESGPERGHVIQYRDIPEE